MVYSPTSLFRASRLAVGLCFFTIQVLAQAPAKQWDRAYGGTLADGIESVQQTADGGYVFGGRSASPISGEKSESSRGGFYDFWVVKTDANGVKQWDKTFGGSGSDNLLSLQQTSDGGYILGGTSESPVSGDKSEPTRGGADYWVVKIDANGLKQWDRTFGGTATENLQVVRQTADGGYLLGGFSNSGATGDKTQPGRGVNDFWLVLVDAQGTKLWDKAFGGSGDDNLYAVEATTDGGVVLGGFSDSGVGGDKTEPSRGGFDYWMLKLDAAFTRQWDRRFGGTSTDQLSALRPTPDGGYVLAGFSFSGASGDRTQPNRGMNDAWLVKVDAQGTKQWDYTAGGSATDELYDLIVTADGGLLFGTESLSGLSGDRTEATRGSYDFWVVKLAPLVTAAAPPARVRPAVYPNPARGRFALHLPAAAPPAGLQLTVIDAAGRTVLTYPLPTVRGEAVTVELGAQPAGLYRVRVDGPNGYKASQQLVLE